MSTYNYEQSNQEQDKRRIEQNSDEGETIKRYNKQSNLYDPEGKTYTPLRDEPDEAPQVDTSPIAEQKKDDPFAPVFENLDEQRAAASRQPGGRSNA